MKATVTQNDLNKGLTQVSRALSGRTAQLPVLNNVLLEAKKSGLIISATNLEIGLRVQVGGKIDTEGTLTVPARDLTEFVGSLASTNIGLESAGGNLKVTTPSSKAVFAGIDASEFPPLPLSTKSGQTLPSQVLSQIASQVAYAAAVDESRPVLTGIKFQTMDNKLIIVATDGFRLARKVISNFKLQISNSLILPARTIIEAARIASESGADQLQLELVAKNNQVIIHSEAIDLVSRVLEGNYPDTEKIIPADSPIQAVLDRGEFMGGLRAVSVFARDNNNIVKFEIRNSKFEIKAQAAQKGEGEVEIEAQTQGEGEIAFNYKFISDILNSFTEERVQLQIKDHLSPGVFRPEKDTSLLALAMPVRI